MLALQVNAPIHGEFKLLLGSLQDLDALGVGQAHERLLEDAVQALDEGIVVHLVEELQVVLAVLQRIVDAELDELLGQIHIVGDVIEGHLGLNHPELGQVARGVAVLSAEGGAKGVDGTQSRCAQLTLELT